jgi:FkbM family methyltransferase
MSTPRINYAPKVLSEMIATQLFAADPFFLVDVGASGGVDSHWDCFAPHLAGVGFDPLKKECDRLNREQASRGIRYVDAFVGADGFEALYPEQIAHQSAGPLPNAYERASSTRAQKIASYSFAQRFNNEDPEIVYTDRHVSLDGFVATEGIKSIDFLKVDTDGHDYEVLVGAKRALADTQVLGAFVECQFHGINHEHSNLFANIDRYLRENGFMLFDLEAYRYTRSVLPGRFVYDIFAQTQEGQMVWGDALYFRDPMAPGYAELWGSLPRIKLLKLVALFELYGLYDCAAELLVAQRDTAFAGLPVDRWLDVLTRELEPGAGSYRQHMAHFAADPRRFFPSPMTASLRSNLPAPLLGVARKLKRSLGM